MTDSPTTDVTRWADSAMFRSESHRAADGPRVHLLAMSADPLGQIAACAKMYKGEVVRSLSDVTHAERQHYMSEMQKTKLKMPLEAVSMHFMFENVTRAFTHQLVRQRTAAYAQESMRFAVVEDMNEAVALPPSLARFNDPAVALETRRRHQVLGMEGLKQDEQWYLRWVDNVAGLSEDYNALIASGMPAEDARGLMPTNIITRVNYITNLRGLLDHAGNRLCTQAQFEWRLVFSQIAAAIRNYGAHDAVLKSAGTNLEEDESALLGQLDSCDRWQFEAIARLLQPVCYQTGSCAFKADFDRKCSIRARVDANADLGRASSEWDREYEDTAAMSGQIVAGVGSRSVVRHEAAGNRPVFIGAIHAGEWLADPSAAR